jgi:hypothetical protein
MAAKSREHEAFRDFLRRVWHDDVGPLLKDKRQPQRAKAARVAGKGAGAAGLFVDTLFGLKGKPFARFMTVMGSSVGAMLPDIWDWKWLREDASDAQRATVAERVVQRAGELPVAAALALFDLSPTASRDALAQAWRRLSRQWHPDKAPDEAARREYHLRFVTYQAAHERLVQAYEAGELPERGSDEDPRRNFS